MKVAVKLRRNFRNQYNCGEITLHVIMIQYAQLYGPLNRLMKAYDSYSTPEYQLMKSSVKYATPTIEPVTMITMFMYSICRTWM